MVPINIIVVDIKFPVTIIANVYATYSYSEIAFQSLLYSEYLQFLTTYIYEKGICQQLFYII